MYKSRHWATEMNKAEKVPALAGKVARFHNGKGRTDVVFFVDSAVGFVQRGAWSCALLVGLNF